MTENSNTCAAHSGIQEALNEIRRSLARLEEGIFGNGKPGLRDRVLILEENQKHLRAVTARNENRMLAAVRLIGPYFFAALAGLAGVMYDKQ
jgi:hypothetical protein